MHNTSLIIIKNLIFNKYEILFDIISFLQWYPIVIFLLIMYFSEAQSKTILGIFCMNYQNPLQTFSAAQPQFCTMHLAITLQSLHLLIWVAIFFQFRKIFIFEKVARVSWALELRCNNPFLFFTWSCHNFKFKRFLCNYKT